MDKENRPCNIIFRGHIIRDIFRDLAKPVSFLSKKVFTVRLDYKCQIKDKYCFSFRYMK